MVSDDDQRQDDSLPQDEWTEGLAGSILLVTVPDNFPLRRHFTKPYAKTDDVPSYELSEAEQEAFDYFEPGVEAVKGDEVETRLPCTWLPHVKYILGNEPMSALFLCQTHPEGVCSLSLVRNSSLELRNYFICFLSLVIICFDLLLFSGDVSLDLEECRSLIMSKPP